MNIRRVVVWRASERRDASKTYETGPACVDDRVSVSSRPRWSVRKNARFLAAPIVAGLATILIVPGALARPQVTPGLTARTVTIGGTFSLSGPASGYAPIPV